MRPAHTLRWLGAPAIAVLALGSFVPLGLTLWFSLLDFKLLEPGGGFVALGNYAVFLSHPMLLGSIGRTLVLTGGVLAITLTLGTALALLLDQAVAGVSVVRMLVVAPFFVMPAVGALVWKNLLMNPVAGLFAQVQRAVGFAPFDWFGTAPLASIILIVSWTWLPFATLILLTALQSLDRDQMDAAALDGAGPLARFRFLVLPHLARPMAVAALIEAIFVLSLFAEIYVTTGGGPGDATTNLSFLIFTQALLRFDIGAASAGGVVAVVLANVVAAMMGRLVGRTLEADR